MNTLFEWEWNEQPPLKSIIEEAQKYPTHIPYLWDDGSTFTNLIFAISKKDAQEKIRTKVPADWKVYLADIHELE